VTIGKKATWSAALVALVVVGLVGRTGAQNAPAQPAGPDPQIPQPNFHTGASKEDVQKYGVKAEDIKAGAVPDFDKLRDPLVVIPVLGNIWMIGGAGGNIAVQVGDDGVLIVDAGAEAASDRVIAELKKLSPRNLRWIINTSADMDRTGGNEKIAKSVIPPPAPGAAPAAPAGGGGAGGANAFNGAGAGIMAHENVLNRMSAPTGQTASRPVDAWPTDTFFTPKKNFWYNGEPMEMWYQPAAHTDGDIIVFFRKSDVIVAGDILAADRFPFIDAAKGGSIQGILDALNRIVGAAVPQYNQQGGTRIIPGHGRIYNQTDVVEYRDMSTIIRDRISMLAKKGMTLDQVKAAHPTLDYDGQYGLVASWTKDMFIEEVYKEVTKPAAAPAGAKKPAATPAKKS